MWVAFLIYYRFCVLLVFVTLIVYNSSDVEIYLECVESGNDHNTHLTVFAAYYLGNCTLLWG